MGVAVFMYMDVWTYGAIEDIGNGYAIDRRHDAAGISEWGRHP
jgi:hypothetical protein